MSVESVRQTTVSQLWVEAKPKLPEPISIEKLKDAVIRQVSDIARVAKTHAGNTEELSAREFLDEIARQSGDLAKKYDAPAPTSTHRLKF